MICIKYTLQALFILLYTYCCTVYNIILIPIYTAIYIYILIYIYEDKCWLNENLLCLISNAVKYSTGGEVIIEVTLRTEERLPGSLQQSPSQHDLKSVDSGQFSADDSPRGGEHEKSTFSASLITRTESQTINLHPTRQVSKSVMLFVNTSKCIFICIYIIYVYMYIYILCLIL